MLDQTHRAADIPMGLLPINATTIRQSNGEVSADMSKEDR